MDEQSPSGNLSSCIFEGFSNQDYFPKIISRSLPERYIFENGGRDYLLNKFGLSNDDIIRISNIYPGMKMQSDEIQQGINRLWDLNRFNDIQIHGLGKRTNSRRHRSRLLCT